MSSVLQAIEDHARLDPEKLALTDGVGGDVGYAALSEGIRNVAKALGKHKPAAVGLLMDNTPAWVISDLATVQAEIPCVPLPLFFSPRQIAHLIASAGIELIFTDQPEALHTLLAAISLEVVGEQQLSIAGRSITVLQLPAARPGLIPQGIAKITFTSGTTGDPKGVCLTQQTIETVAGSLQRACGAEANDRHLCALPLATLLENIGGVYVPLLAGATCVLPGLAAVGLKGSSGLDAAAFLRAMIGFEIKTCILIPQMLLALVSAVHASGKRPEGLRYAAVGGAPVSLQQLQQAKALGLPVFEGYGLSEAGSVVAVNAPGAVQAGAVGKPLAHVQLKFSEDGEILVKGALFSGYLGQPGTAPEDGYYATGDIGHLDKDGFLHITGRKKHIFITAFGRNVSPEWVERELTIQPGIAQAVVFGESRAFNVAILTPRDGVDKSHVQQYVDAANAQLPDYARVSRWLLADAPFSLANGLFTGTGRPRREAIMKVYGERINSIYGE
ncbi:MAG: long-chain acyl-CoA synthetase [Zetaproteobacteria bacterium CG12_big_fil_rev_8_21_14_0_65_55_1124]|nr:MAG: long-chain acyl-CoA synthetase [Zetaproteobacteria bacterium CG1_02_55_237]PIS19977.1 MAG: long-chain acyl-CoA synthetase [Zetaproteobacteria bacterium CG08_land_8_20_14_0_20_55_17]PIW43601.1 MAG: long-chain acyl-CoA synthetase [Zetaproteobacteria bacterium CG12_big_fil_rev_8_21_14_0_65_55_1124]PIY52731.1 MAG: long-chain acyl-CoA synthetase [Zetaproteobacteria bacterium CG_4_10_14_0_8_um_filter_55_43]PIZ37915.1 MAG: long-chain acyl-CoA synthetase [Zetaproteobacteria bacterium CG_4_10_14